MYICVWILSFSCYHRHNISRESLKRYWLWGLVFDTPLPRPRTLPMTLPVFAAAVAVVVVVVIAIVDSGSGGDVDVDVVGDVFPMPHALLCNWSSKEANCKRSANQLTSSTYTPHLPHLSLQANFCTCLHIHMISYCLGCGFEIPHHAALFHSPAPSSRSSSSALRVSSAFAAASRRFASTYALPMHMYIFPLALPISA